MLKSTAQSGQTDLLLARLGIPTHHDPQYSMQFALLSRIKAKQRQMHVLLEDIKQFREMNDFVHAALALRKAIHLRDLPAARAELADFFRTGRPMKENTRRDEYYDGENHHNKAHALVYGQDDPDCKGVLALLYLDYLDNEENFGWDLPNDPLFGSKMQMGEMGEAAMRLAQESKDAGSKYGIYALGRWNFRWNVREISNQMHHQMRVSPSGETIEQLRSELLRSIRDGVTLIGIAANPPYSYDVAQYAYADCVKIAYAEGVKIDDDEDYYSISDKSEKYFEMAAAQGFRGTIGMR
jgi:hypothetical protein